MPLAGDELFERTIEVMVPGDTLMVFGGTLPGEGESAEIQLGMQAIIPLLQLVSTSGNYPTRPNLFVGEEDPITLTLNRNANRFGHDPGGDISIGTRAGEILGHTVDIVNADHGRRLYVAKSTPVEDTMLARQLAEFTGPQLPADEEWVRQLFTDPGREMGVREIVESVVVNNNGKQSDADRLMHSLWESTTNLPPHLEKQRTLIMQLLGYAQETTDI